MRFEVGYTDHKLKNLLYELLNKNKQLINTFKDYLKLTYFSRNDLEELTMKDIKKSCVKINWDECLGKLKESNSLKPYFDS